MGRGTSVDLTSWRAMPTATGRGTEDDDGSMKLSSLCADSNNPLELVTESLHSLYHLFRSFP